MIAIPATALALFSRWWKLALGIVVGAVLCFPLAHCQGRKDGRAQMQLAIEQANTHFLTQKTHADKLTAKQHLTDQRASDDLERNLADAVANIPDSLPTARRLARACAQLRAQRVDTSSLPQCQ